MPRFIDAHGVAITYYDWTVESPRAVVQLLHGVGEHAGRYPYLVAKLNTAGYSVYAEDHRGHGQTGLDQWAGDPKKLGHLGPGGHRATVASIHQFTSMIRAENPQLPLVMLGHSWGSLIAQILLNQHPNAYDGVVLSGTAFRTLRHMNSGDLNRRHKVAGGTGVEWLSRDESVQRGFLADPLTVDAKVLTLFGVADALRLFGRPARALNERMPLLIQVGEDDPLGGPVSARRLADAYRSRSGLTDVTLLTYPDARHEIYNELNRDEIIADLVGWLRTHF